MKRFTATEAKNRFGELLDDAMVNPIMIQKNGRDVAVLLSKADFDNRLSIGAQKERIRQLHEESMQRYDAVYRELAK